MLSSDSVAFRRCKIIRFSESRSRKHFSLKIFIEIRVHARAPIYIFDEAVVTEPVA